VSTLRAARRHLFLPSPRSHSSSALLRNTGRSRPASNDSADIRTLPLVRRTGGSIRRETPTHDWIACRSFRLRTFLKARDRKLVLEHVLSSRGGSGYGHGDQRGTAYDGGD